MAIIKRKDIIEVDAVLKDLKAINAEINTLTLSMKDLQKTKRSLNDESTGANAKKAVDLTKQLDSATSKLSASMQEEAKLIAIVKQQTLENNKALRQNAKEVLGLTDEYEKQSKQLTKLRREAKSQTLTLQKGRKELGLSRKEYRKQRKELAATSREVNKLDQNLKKVDSSFGQSQRFVGQYGKALKGVGTQLLGAAGIVGGVQLLVDGFQAFNETANQVNDLTRKIGTNFGVFGKSAKELAAQVNAIATTFDQDYNEVLIAANTVSKELGITGAEATALIEEGFLKGSNNSGEFLDILKEYPAQFASVGIDAETAFAIINQQVREGIYSDKGVDAIKEAGLRLRENTKAVQAALAPLDESIRKQIEQEVAAGNSFKAIQLVSEALKDTSLSAEQTQAIIADVFGGPGEDAGLRYLQTLSDIESSLDGVAIQASESEQASLALSQSWNRFVAGVSDSNGIFGKVFAFLKNALAGAINSLSKLIELVSGGEKAVDRIRATVERLKKAQQEQTNETDKNTESTTKNTTARTKNTTSVDKQNKALLRQIKIQQNIRKLRDKEIAGVSAEEEKVETSEEAAFESIDETVELEDKRAEKELEFQDSLNAQKLEQEKAFQEAKQELANSFIEQGFQFASDIAASETSARLAEIEEAAEREKEILQQRLDDGLISEAEFRQKVAEIDKKARQDSAKAEKRGAIFQIGIDTAAAIVKALGSAPPPFNFINAGLVAAQGAIQAAFVAAKPLPSFGEGGEIQGKPHSQGGVNINAEGGEYMIKKDSYANAPLTTEMINRGLITDKDLAQGMTRTQTDGLKASLLMQGNKINSQILTAILNGGFSSENKDFYIIHRNDGSVTKIPKS